MKKKFIPVKSAIENAVFECAIERLVPIMKDSSIPPGDFIEMVVNVYAESFVTGELAAVAKEEGLTPDEVLNYFRRGLLLAINENK